MSGAFQGRFANIRTVRYTFPDACQCPGQPHAEDEAWIVFRPSASAKARIGRAELEGAVRLDPMAAYRQTVIEGVARWNLLMLNPEIEDPDEQAAAPPVQAPVNQATVELLDESLMPLAEWIDNLWSGGPDPNSSAPSRGSRRGRSRQARTKTPAHGT